MAEPVGAGSPANAPKGAPARSRLPATLVRFFSIAPVTIAMMRIATAIDRPLMRWTRGRWRLSFVIPLLLLECRGARTRLVRRVPLLYVPSGADCLVVGSNAGRPSDPAWCHNLRAQADVTALLGGRRVAFRARELEGDEAEAEWRRATAFYRGYDAYRARAHRRIPLFKLERVEEGREVRNP